jgi:hypothetical protein
MTSASRKSLLLIYSQPLWDAFECFGILPHDEFQATFRQSECATRGQRYRHGTIHLDFVKERLMRNRGNRGNHGRIGRNDWHQRAAEYHDLAAHAHRVAATHHGQEDHRTGHEFSKQAMEYSAKAYQYSQEAHQKSGSSLSETAEAARTGPVKPANGVGKRSKKKA